MSGMNDKKRDKKKKKKHKRSKNRESGAAETEDLLSNDRVSSGESSGDKLIFN